ncbi:MAG: nickel pincer cofactor biosynthesis protein LarC [Proteobacteria bacterium]|nr:nickel pincer cofactor biosynthesis protein LarC [Pseudomonadota bacterium]
MIAYFDCFSGISGDMVLGAMVNLGVDCAWLESRLAEMPLTGFSLSAGVEGRHRIHGTRVKVLCHEDHPPHRNWADIREMIVASPYSPRVKGQALEAFGRIARAEGQVHHQDPETVHFHEVGGVDALVDVLGAFLAAERLGITEATASPIPLGHGFVKCAHGTLPVPAPATAAILSGVPVYGSGVEAELTTPTGAALVTTFCSHFGPLPSMKIQKTGFGVGGRDLPDRPNCLRLFLGEPDPGLSTDRVAVVETNLDDVPAEHLGFLMERLLAAGALDVLFLPAQMKKNRPGVLVQVLCAPGDRGEILQVLFSETPTLGIRWRETDRAVLPREPVTVDTPYGPIQAKRAALPLGGVRLYPEYESCRKAALAHGIPLREVYEAVARVNPG